MVAAVLRHLTVISRKDWQAKVGVTGYIDQCYNFVNIASRFRNTEQEVPDGSWTIMLYCPIAICFLVWALGYRVQLSVFHQFHEMQHFPEKTLARASREPMLEFHVESWADLFTLHCSRLLNCKNEYLAADSGGYLYMQSWQVLAVWLNASQTITWCSVKQVCPGVK